MVLSDCSITVIEENDEKEKRDIDENEGLIKINLAGKEVNIKEDIFLINDPVQDSIDTFKNMLIDAIDELKHEINFLRNEMEEKNLFIRTLLIRDANENINPFDSMNYVNKTTHEVLHEVETTSTN